MPDDSADLGFNRIGQTRHGRFLYNHNDHYIGRSIERYGESSELELELLRQLCGPGSVVFDVGANVGDHALPLARHVMPSGVVFAFEPVRVLFQTLCANIALNSLVNVECVNAAVGEASGHVLIPEVDFSRAGNYGAFELASFSQGRPVRKVTLDEFADGLSRVDLVKIDVEGMESAVLAGARRLLATFRPLLYVENDRVESSRHLIETLWRLEYRLYWHLPPLYNPHNFRGESENIFPNVVACNMLCIPRERPAAAEGFDEITDPAQHPKNQA